MGILHSSLAGWRNGLSSNEATEQGHNADLDHMLSSQPGFIDIFLLKAIK